MNAVEQALRDFLSARPGDVAIALVGGLAVSARTEPRFTRDLDFAVALTNDDEASEYVFRLRQLGYEVQTLVEQTARSRPSMIRLRHHGRSPLVDLLFASSGIETEVVAASEAIEVVAGLVAQVARVGHLIAMKLVSRDDDLRPQDRGDLAALSKVADVVEWERAEAAVQLIEARGFARNRDLRRALGEWRGRV